MIRIVQRGQQRRPPAASARQAKLDNTRLATPTRGAAGPVMLARAPDAVQAYEGEGARASLSPRSLMHDAGAEEHDDQGHTEQCEQREQQHRLSSADRLPFWERRSFVQDPSTGSSGRPAPTWRC